MTTMSIHLRCRKTPTSACGLCQLIVHQKTTVDEVSGGKEGHSWFIIFFKKKKDHSYEDHAPKGENGRTSWSTALWRVALVQIRLGVGGVFPHSWSQIN